MNEITFTSGGATCAAWHLPAVGDAFAGESGRPCIVIGHGWAGTRDSALLPYAEGFAEAGIDALVFDYRGFGDSQGAPRQRISYRRQRADYRAAVAAARRLPGVDPDRIVLWGTSYSGGHVLAVAAGDPRIAAVIAMTAATDGLAVLLGMLRHSGPGRLARLTAAGLHDLGRAATGRTPRFLPAVGPEGSAAVIANDVGAEAYPAMAGPTWRNEVTARSALGVGLNRPVRFASRLECPLLVQIGTLDTVVPPAAQERAARRAGNRAEVRRYPVDHFDVYAGDWQQQALADQLQFLRRHLAGSAIPDQEVETTC